MYVGTYSISKLASFLRGYEYALYRMGDSCAFAFLGGFRDWIQHRFQTTELSWEDIILQNSASETEAVDRFWNFLDDYFLALQDANLQHDRHDFHSVPANGVQEKIMRAEQSR